MKPIRVQYHDDPESKGSIVSFQPQMDYAGGWAIVAVVVWDWGSLTWEKFARLRVMGNEELNVQHPKYHPKWTVEL